MREIPIFWGKYRYLSNFYEAGFTYKGVYYPTAEHAYQSLKLKHPEHRALVRDAETPGEAKKLGRRYSLRDNFEQVKLKIMRRVVYEKFKQNKELTEKIIATEGYDLREGNTWHDDFWGDCVCEKHRHKPGENHLGLILMQVRRRLIREQSKG